MMKILVDGVLKVIEQTPEEIAEMEDAHAAYLASREYKFQRIEALKAELAASDYKAIKFAEGWIPEEGYAPIREERQKIRDEINKLEFALSHEHC